MTDCDPLEAHTKTYLRARIREFECDDPLDNGSTTDTKQWCQLHRGHCNDVVPIRRHFDDPNRQDEIFLACQRCVRDLKKAELITSSKYAKMECFEVVVPKGLSGRREVDLCCIRPQKRIEPWQRAYEVTLDALQVKYLRALGLWVIPA